MRIGDVSKQLNIPSSTIRYYEKEGLIDLQSRVSGRRDFDQKSLFSLQFIQLAQAAGFTISEMKLLLETYRMKPNVSEMWMDMAKTKQKSIRKQIQDLKRMDQVLEKLIDCNCETIGECVEFAFTKER